MAREGETERQRDTARAITNHQSPIPPPAEERFVDVGGGVRLWVRRWRAETDRTLILTHGLCEHSGRHEHIVPLLHERGWNVVLWDMRGHGRSAGGPRTHVDRFEKFVSDLHAVRIDAGSPPECTALVGFSAGGLVTARYVQSQSRETRGEDRAIRPRPAGSAGAQPRGFGLSSLVSHPSSLPAAMVLLSPLFQVRMPVPRWKIVAGRLASLMFPKTRFRTGIDAVDAVRTADGARERAADPLVEPCVTAGLYFALLDALRSVESDAAAVTTPTLIVQSAEDRLVDPAAPQRWLERTGSRDREFRLVPDAYHELLHEPNWPETVRQMLDWLESRITVR